jgi:mRNA interferase HicA
MSEAWIKDSLQYKQYCLYLRSDEQRVSSLAWRAGAVFKPGRGSHLKVYRNGRQSVLPMHNAELKKGLIEAIKKQLGLK